MKHKNAILCMLALSGGLLNACQQDTPNRMPTTETIKYYAQATTLQGTISGDKGFVATGTLKVTDKSGQLIASSVLHNDKKYAVDIPANTALPLILTFHPDTTQTKTTELMSVVVHPSITKYDISPLTTQIAKQALALGGYTAANMVRAAENTVHVPDADKTSSGFRGDPTTHYGGWH
jgi:hypothetical protein